jgi:hypothetical protein
MCVASTISGVGYLILLLSENNRARFFAVFCIVGGTYTTIGLQIAWFAHNLGSETKKAAGIPMFMAIGQCGSVLGSHIYPKTDSPDYIKGFAVSCALSFLAAACSALLSCVYRYKNSCRDKVHGKPQANTRVDVSELADEAPSFRYMP